MRDPFETARKFAETGSGQVTRYSHSSVILDRRGRIIGRGKNHFAGKIIDTIEGPIDKTVHSEIAALRKVDIRKLSGATIINYAKTNIAAILARPCLNCWAMLKNLGFKKVFYSVRTDFANPTVWKEEFF